MNLSSIFSDDQLAVIGCLAALTVCGLIAMVSFRFGPVGRDASSTSSDTIPVRPIRIRNTGKPQDRRAA